MKYMGDAEQANFNGSWLDATGIFPAKTKKREKLSLRTAQYVSQHFSWDTAAVYWFLMCPKACVVGCYHTDIHSELGKSAKATSLNFLGAQAVVPKNLFLNSSASRRDSLWDSPNELRRISCVYMD